MNKKKEAVLIEWPFLIKKEGMKQISMPYKPRTISPEILVLQSLNQRMDLDLNEKQYLAHLKKG
ncbi:hypothetical protein CHH55_17385 [Niallia circulans]|uniref:hypothetical protein n=1 Tax=Niallia circulans TaxID=1397 RepID=UPI0009E5ABD8|nr:hypothetical protein [Niallia circulans]MED5098926.1 hypothetical protein [Niallia circulans]PAD25523.1 hypothetical protein CHH62_12120 [Niallia circulans]PAD86579.1 hypothetical protein CHH55_17385 [Niallia circulans]PAE10161.1 hypothetical protein CHI02_21575 [Niallia circulans]